MFPNPPLFGTSAAARLVGVCEATLLSYCAQGVINPARDSAGRRIFTPTDIEKAKAYRERNKDGNGD